MKKAICMFALSASLLGGCASIVGDKTQLLPISSSPSDATVLITDEKGAQVFKGETPTSVTLQKSDGTYWGGKFFTVEISKAGYKTQSIPVESNSNGWYIGGNLIFGGLIGWFIVDPMNGAMYTLSPEQITSELNPEAAHNNNGAEGSISIVLLEDVPNSLREKMVKVN